MLRAEGSYRTRTKKPPIRFSLMAAMKGARGKLDLQKTLNYKIRLSRAACAESVLQTRSGRSRVAAGYQVLAWTSAKLASGRVFRPSRQIRSDLSCCRSEKQCGSCS